MSHTGDFIRRMAQHLRKFAPNVADDADQLTEMACDFEAMEAQNERLTDHIETHHRYFTELHETAVRLREQGGMTSNDFADFVINRTHPNPGERG